MTAALPQDPAERPWARFLLGLAQDIAGTDSHNPLALSPTVLRGLAEHVVRHSQTTSDTVLKTGRMLDRWGGKAESRLLQKLCNLHGRDVCALPGLSAGVAIRLFSHADNLLRLGAMMADVETTLGRKQPTRI